MLHNIVSLGCIIGIPQKDQFNVVVNLNEPLQISYISGDGNDVMLIDNEGLFTNNFQGKSAHDKKVKKDRSRRQYRLRVHILFC